LKEEIEIGLNNWEECLETLMEEKSDGEAAKSAGNGEWQ